MGVPRGPAVERAREGARQIEPMDARRFGQAGPRGTPIARRPGRSPYFLYPRFHILSHSLNKLIYAYGALIPGFPAPKRHSGALSLFFAYD